MLVAAGEESAMFVAFDASMNKLANVMVPEVANPIVYYLTIIKKIYTKILRVFLIWDYRITNVCFDQLQRHGEQRTNRIQSPSIPTGHCWEDLHIPSQAY